MIAEYLVRHQPRVILGLSSFIGTRLSSSNRLPGPATEILIIGQDCTRLRIASVGQEGTVCQGVLSGFNIVCIKAELLLTDA